MYYRTLVFLSYWWEGPQKYNYKTFRNNANNKLLKQAQKLAKILTIIYPSKILVYTEIVEQVR